MEFRILGPLEVVENGSAVELGGARQRQLLALLLLRANDVVPRERLIDELWEEHPPDTARTALQVHVSQLRKALGRDAIITQAPGYALRVGPDELDLSCFETLVAEARAKRPAEAAAVLREALALWRGPPLAELGGVALARERLRLEELRLSALEERIEADLRLGRHVDLVPELDGLVRDHPLRERLRGQLMLALYRSGRQADALEVYRRGRLLFDEQLGLEPGEALRELERGILRQDPALGLPSPAPAAPVGTVTFLFTDVEGSTALVKRLGDRYAEMLADQQRILREAVANNGGHEIDTQGDSFFFVFARARDAVVAASEAQHALAAHTWPEELEARVRMGLHTGEPAVGSERYTGLGVHRASRICDAGHGGQILLSNASRELVEDDLPEGMRLRDLGVQRLKDIDRPERLYQLLVEGLPSEFPPLRNVQRRRRRAAILVAAGVLILAGVGAGLAVLLAGGGSSPVAVLPNSVAAVDVKENRIVADVPIGGRPVGLAYGLGAVWAANADDRTVVRIDPKTYEVVKTIGLGVDVSDVAAGLGSVWVAGGNDGTLTRIDPRQNAVEATLKLGGSDPLAPRPVFLVTTGERAVWVARLRDVLRIDPETNEVTARVAVNGPLGIAAGAGSVWVTTIDERLLRIDARAAVVSASAQLPDQGYFPVVARGSVWLVTLNQDGQVERFDPDTLSSTATVPILWAIGLAAGEGAVWTAGHLDGKVWRIDSASAGAVSLARVQHHPRRVAVGAGAVWIGVQREPLR